jgi:pyruvate,water dikinase
VEIILVVTLIGLSFGIGGLPLINWISILLTGQNLNQVGTGNISVSAAFYHGGKLVGILAVISEAAKGIGVVLLARILLSGAEFWQIIAIIALVWGRYSLAKGAGTTNAFWGIVTYDIWSAVLTLSLGGLVFKIWRQRQITKIVILILLGLIIIWRHLQQPGVIIAIIALCLSLGWIIRDVPDDLTLSTSKVNPESRKMFNFFRGPDTLISLEKSLSSLKFGAKAANLSQLKGWGYLVPDGWVIDSDTSLESILAVVNPSGENPLVVRSSVVGEDDCYISAAGQYETKLNITNRSELAEAIADCLASYQSINAEKYRQDQGQKEQKMALIVQKQVKGVFSGVAFSRDPLNPGDETVLIEAFPGDASLVVSGKVTPQSYRVKVNEDKTRDNFSLSQAEVIDAIAQIARELETRYHGIPQDIEWTYDGQCLWLLQTRPITTLQPLWTRKIASEVIPGVIKPLTWSINRPLTCGVWGEIFTLVLGKRAEGLDFTATATLHWGRAYFNASLLGDIFRRMGLPPESLEFLTRGAKMSKPPLQSTLINIPGLFRLLGREWRLAKDWERDNRLYFQPLLASLKTPATDLSPQEIIKRINEILNVLKQATYYSILAPLSLALRQGIFKVDITSLDNSMTPEVQSLRSLSELARKTALLVPNPSSSQDLFNSLSQSTQGQVILGKFQDLLSRYAYLSETATDISISRWGDHPNLVQEQFYQLLNQPQPPVREKPSNNLRGKIVQQRLNLKGQVTEVYSQLLAHLRWSFLALGEKLGKIDSKESLFWLEYSEITENQINLEIIRERKANWQEFTKLTNIPYIVYGNYPGELNSEELTLTGENLTGIGASPGEKTGIIKVVRNFADLSGINKEMILVVPYTDSGWGPFLAQAGGIIAEVGGILSHGAIIAREYGIPAVMDLHNATEIFKNGQKVKINGQRGIVETIK